MFFSVRELEVKKLPFDVTYPPGEIEFPEELRQADPLHAEGVAELIGNTLAEIRVRGQVQVKMEAACDRCLEQVEVQVDNGFDLFYRPADHAPSGEEVAIDAGESEMGFYQGSGLALEDVLREHILLSMPMQQVCQDACKGICPVCGQNRNEKDCHCEPRLADDRWAALRNFKTP